MNRPTVRIIVLEPSEWNQGNLFGEILSDRGGNRLKIKLTQSIKGRMFSSDILILSPLIKNETFKPLHQYYAVGVNGSIVNEQTNEQELVITGHVTYD